MNVSLLRRVKKHILEEPSRFAMEWWYGKAIPGTAPSMFDDESVAPRCGTVACLAGWSVVLSDKKINAADNSYDQGQYIQMRAQQLLRLTDEQSDQLFAVDDWPEEFADRYDLAETRRDRAEAAADRIEHFIKTGE